MTGNVYFYVMHTCFALQLFAIYRWTNFSNC